jgi:hypothetical protein
MKKNIEKFIELKDIILMINTKEKIEGIVKKFSNEESGVEVKDRKYHLKTYHQCFIGTDGVLWLMKNYDINTESAEKLGFLFFND